MTAEQNRWERLRDQAQAYLPNDFAWQVVRRLRIVINPIGASMY
jgi:hypothetical protein